MKSIFFGLLLLLSLNSFSQGFFNVVYSGNVYRFSGESGADIPLGLHIAYKQDNNIGIYTSFKMNSGSESDEKYLNFNAYQSADKRDGEAFDYFLFNIGVNDFVYENIGAFLGFGFAGITEYQLYRTTNKALGNGSSYYLPNDKMQKKLNLNIGVFMRIEDIAVVHVDFDSAISGIGIGVGLSLPDMFKVSIKEMYDSDEIYKPAETTVLEE